jgi:integrase
VQRSLKERKGTLELKETKTKHGRRRIRLTSATLAAMNDHRMAMLAEGHDVRNGPVFCDTKGGWLRKSNFARNSFEVALKRSRLTLLRSKAGKPKVRFHDLRHTCATMLLLEDVNVKIVSERLGHASIEITLNTYQHVLPTMQQRAAEKLESVIGRMVPKKRIP